MMPENLLTLEPKERHEIYRMLRLRVAAYPDGTLLASGALGEADHVYTTETTSRCYGQSTRGSGLPGSSIHHSGSAESGKRFSSCMMLIILHGKVHAAERKVLASEV
jgi:hypothetical protein